MVSLLVSFTLTPMMSARLLRTRTPRRARRRTAAADIAQRLLRLIDRVYTRMLRLRRCGIGCAVGVARAARHRCPSVPLYRAVKQEYMPSDVDEAEFEVNVTAPEGTSIAAMDEAMQRDREGAAQTSAACDWCSSTAGGGFLGRRQPGQRLRAHRAARRAHASRSTRSGSELSAGHPLRRLPRQLHAARRDAGGPRSGCASIRDLRPRVRNFAVVQHRRRQLRHRLRHPRPGLEKLAEYAEQLCANEPQELGGIVDADTTLKLDKPELRVAHRPRPRRRPGRRHVATSAPRCA